MAGFFILKLLSFFVLLNNPSEQHDLVDKDTGAFNVDAIVFPGDSRLRSKHGVQQTERTIDEELSDLFIYHDTDYAKPRETDHRLVADFAFRLDGFHRKLTYTVLTDNPGKNIIYSPISVSTMLMMIAIGARRETQSEIFVKTGLSFDNKIVYGFPEIIEIFKNIHGVQLNITNRVFASEEETVQPNYQMYISNILHSQLQLIDFRDSQNAAKIINGWCKNQTNNHITEITNPDELSDVLLLLVNAVYFKGDWKLPFEVSNTLNNVPFYVDNNKIVNVSMMNLEGEFNWGRIQELKTRFIELPYASEEHDNESLSMYLLVPTEKNGLTRLEKNIKLIDFKLLDFYEETAKLSLPKFKIQSALELKPILEKVGIRTVFGESADLTSMINNRRLRVNKIIQKAFLEVNEKGSEAAALTESEFSNRQEVGLIVADRPFLFAIVLKKLGIPLFCGRIADPTEFE